MARAGNGLVFVGLGAALMYLMDPQAGRKRRADLRNQLGATRRRIEQGKERVVRDASNRTHGMLVRTQQWIRGRKEQYELRRSQGTGLVAGETVSRAADTWRGAVAPWQRRRWSPAQRALAGAFGAGLATSGYARGGVAGLGMAAAGVALLARAFLNDELATVVKGQPIRVDKTLRIAAPVEQVYAYWRNLENFPQWMSHVRQVRYVGGDRFHWTVDGPAGAPVEWDAELADVHENREMAWRSVEGSTVDNRGRVRFEHDRDGGTRVHVELEYMPPGGVLGHAVAKAFGVDPKTEMDDDLQKLKSLIETGRLPRDTAADRLGGWNAGASPAQ